MAAYERIKRHRGVVDFDDLLEQNLRAVETDKAFRELVHWRFRHLFVDEAQDLNPLQHALLEAWRGGRADICLVGDPRQAIYGWNGADHTTLTEVERFYPGVTVVSLVTNYRCSPQVVDAGAAALEAGGQRDDTSSNRPDGPALVIEPYATVDAEAGAIARTVRTALDAHAPASIAVLARTNDQLGPIGAALSALGIATQRAAGRSPLEQALSEVYRLGHREALALWADEQFALQDPLRRRVAEEIDRFLASHEPGGFRSWVDARDPFDELDDDDGEGAVSLLTFHGAKGREWPVVIVAGVEEGLIPHSSALSPAQRAEEARLLYVAITRAIDRLVLTRSESRDQPVA
jgi:DNA helicase-2/ATP-dependent DNA helicase PcrA